MKAGEDNQPQSFQIKLFDRIRTLVTGWNGLLLLIVLVILGAFFYKSLTTGTLYDESLTFKDYCSDIHQARHSFKSTNNHVLNSVCIIFAKRCFGNVVQFIRIPTLITGTIFILSMTWMIRKMVVHPMIRCLTLFFIFCIPFVFSYLFTARGYSYGMMAMGGYLVGGVYFCEHPVRLKFAWLPILCFSFLNFVALGAMINSVFIVFSLNTVFVLWMAPRIYADTIRPLYAILLTGLGIAAVSGGALLWFYAPILNDVIHVADNPYVASIAQGWKGWKSFVPFIQTLFVRCIFNYAKGGRWYFYIFIALVVSGFAARLFSLWKHGVASQIKHILRKPSPGIFVLFVFLVYFGLLFFVSVILGKSPGLERGHVLFLPLIGLLFGWLLDGLLQRMPANRWRLAAAAFICVYLFVAAFHYKPSFKPGRTAMSLHVLNRLKEYDAQRTWNLCFSQKMISQSMGFRYYQNQFGYQFNITGLQQSDVIICSPDEQPKGSVCIDYDYFLDQCQCVLVVNAKLDMEKYIIEITPKRMD